MHHRTPGFGLYMIPALNALAAAAQVRVMTLECLLHAHSALWPGLQNASADLTAAMAAAYSAFNQALPKDAAGLQHWTTLYWQSIGYTPPPP